MGVMQPLERGVSAMGVMQPLERGRGPNKVPVLSLLVVGALVLTFVLVGEINRLAPIVTVAFLLSYASIDYAYFALAHAFDAQKARERRFQLRQTQHTGELASPSALKQGTLTSSAAAVSTSPKETSSSSRHNPSRAEGPSSSGAVIPPALSTTPSSWTVGQKCSAPWSENGKYHNALIEHINTVGEVT
ncbi:unnamed protein product, partial [Cyprideis torosa]